MSDTSEAIRLIELTSTRLRGVVPADLPPLDGHAAATPHGWVAGRAPGDPNGRNKLLAAAWGLEDDAIPSGRLRFLASGLPNDVTVDHGSLAEPCDFPPPLGRVLVNVLLLAAESLPFGGTIRLAGSPGDLFLQIAGHAAAWPAGMAACVVDEAAAVAAMAKVAGDDTTPEMAAGVQMPLTTLLAHASRVRMSFLMSPASRSEPPLLRLGGD